MSYMARDPEYTLFRNTRTALAVLAVSLGAIGISLKKNYDDSHIDSVGTPAAHYTGEMPVAWSGTYEDGVETTINIYADGAEEVDKEFCTGPIHVYIDGATGEVRRQLSIGCARSLPDHDMLGNYAVNVFNMTVPFSSESLQRSPFPVSPSS